ncbi:SAM-dependent methyltransferase [Paenibacillus baekrokdamisoli]|uniref:SAM-dependent methyltransferase n=1 Tax=Paenibacillus baekrokdamisoli TaxID=1712516 RepID=A0A3G9J8Y6_9BACL|nr:class I SAM-dependent methyltransferase [Paenibacillus baekrokdamisoli]MBB3072232.1 SAM-dependent methyltransferase [Paenibacillus baekrokdamisoli]BBH24815.1 SAM-dependent methyltransferase [Paenibacillus baekrokdamisoli]
MGFLSVLSMAHKLIKERVQPGDTVVDATCGNGVDAQFLAELVGSRGTLYAFDIQEQALTRTAERLNASLPVQAVEHASQAEGPAPSRANSMKEYPLPKLHLVLDSHEVMANHIAVNSQGQIAAIMFNLGYLPGADPSIITLTEPTLIALQSAIMLLRKGGILTIVLYPGHSGGDAETIAVEQWAANLPQQIGQAVVYKRIQRSDAPFLVAIEKL